MGPIARIIGEAGIQIEPESAGFASELRGDLQRDLAAATAGLDRDVRVRVTTDADVAERQIRNALARVQVITNQIFERTRARAQQLYTFLEQRVVIRIANKIREWTQKTIVRLKLLMQPFWQFMRERLDQIRRGWQAVRDVAERGADAVARKWTQGMAILSSQMSRVRQAGRRIFIGLADAAEPHIARARRALEALQKPFQVLRAYGVGTFRIIGDAATRAGQRIGTAFSNGFARATRPLRDFRSGMRDVMSALDEGASKSTKFGALTRLAMVRAAQGIISAAVRFGDFSDRITKGEGLIRAAGQKIGLAFRLVGQAISGADDIGIRFGNSIKRVGDRVSGTSRVSRTFGGVIRGMGSAFNGVTKLGGLFSGVLDNIEAGIGRNIGGIGGFVGMLANLAGGFAKVAVIGGAVTYVIGAVSAALVALPGLAAGAVAILGTIALGMDGIKKAYENGLKPALDKLKTQISEVFEQKLTPAFRKLSTDLLPQITDKMKTLATSVANVGVHMVDLVTKGENVAKINKLIDTMAQIIASQVDPALQKLVQSFLDLGSNAQILNEIGGMFTDLITKTADWLAEMNRTGEATRAVSALRDVMSSVEDAFFRVATAAARFFSDATPGVTKLIDSSGRLVDLVGRMGGAFGKAAGAAADLINAIPQSTLDAIGDSVDRLGEALQKAGQNKDLQRVLSDLAAAIPGVIDGFTQLVDACSNVASAFTDVQYGIAKADEFLESLGLGWTTEAERALIASKENEGAADRTATAVEDGVDRSKESLDTLPPKAEEAGQGVEDGVKPPVERIPGVVDDATGQVSFQPVLDAATQVFGQLPTVVSDSVNKAVTSMDQATQKIRTSAETGFKAASDAASTAMTSLSQVVEQNMQSAGASAEVGGQRIGEGVRTGTTSASDAATSGMERVSQAVEAGMDRAATAASTGGRQIADAVRASCDQAAQAATDGMNRVAQSVTDGMNRAADAARSGGDRIADAVRTAAERAADGARAGMDRVVDAVRSAMDQAVSAAQSGAERIRSAVESGFTGVTTAVEQAMQRCTQAITQGMQRCTQTVTQGVTQIRTVYTQGFQQIVQVVTQAWQRIVQAFVQGGQRAVQIARQAAQQIVQTFQSMAGPMYSAGYTLIQRLTAGMIAAGAQATAAAARIAASIKAQFPSSPAKEGPLSGRGDPLRSGGVIVGRLAEGMAANAAAVTLALDPILRQLSERVVSAPLPISVGATSSSSSAAGSGSVDAAAARTRVEQVVRASVTSSSDGGATLAELRAQTATLAAILREVAAGGYSSDMLDRLDALVDASSNGAAAPAAVKTQRQRSLAALGLMG